MDCLSCDGNGYLVFGNGKTKECIACEGKGKINGGEENYCRASTTFQPTKITGGAYMNNPHKPGPITTRAMTEEEREYFRKRQQELRKANTSLKKPAVYTYPSTQERQARG